MSLDTLVGLVLVSLFCFSDTAVCFQVKGAYPILSSRLGGMNYAELSDVAESTRAPPGRVSLVVLHVLGTQ